MTATPSEDKAFNCNFNLWFFQIGIITSVIISSFRTKLASLHTVPSVNYAINNLALCR